jgi:aminoglycoside 3-N-acetyltransferase
VKKKIRDTIRSLTPGFLLRAFRKQKKKQTNKALDQQKQSGSGATKEQLVAQLKAMGIAAGDTLLVHSALSKMGYIEGGPKTVTEALLSVIGTTGHLLMPSSPNAALQKEYIQTLDQFDVNNSPSKLGAVTECFRKMEGVQRSLHPTEPVCAFGPDANYFVKDHFGELTPYTSKSPFYRVSERKGKILYAGVTLDNAGTNLHTLEDAVEFKYPVYFDQVFDVKVVDKDGQQHMMKTKVHNPEFSKRRKCDELLPMFEKLGAMERVKLGTADCLLFDAERMFEVMVEQYQQSEITMYTPNGEIIAGWD